MCILAYDLTWLFSPKDYWYAIVSATIGAAIGIWWAKRQFEKERHRNRTRSLSRLRESVQFNIDRLNQMNQQLSSSEIPNYPLDTAQLNHWLAQSHDFIDAELLRKLDWQRFQMDHVTAKLVVINNAVVSQSNPSASSTSATPQAISGAHLTSLQEHIKGILENLPGLLAQIPEQ